LWEIVRPRMLSLKGQGGLVDPASAGMTIVDARDKPGHDEIRAVVISLTPLRGYPSPRILSGSRTLPKESGCAGITEFRLAPE